MESLITSALAWAATSAIFSVVGLKQGARRWLGAKTLLYPQINETQIADPDALAERLRLGALTDNN
jgi:hypothetical protein